MKFLKILATLILCGIGVIIYLLFQRSNDTARKKEADKIEQNNYPAVALPKSSKTYKSETKKIEHLPSVPSKVYQLLDFVVENRIAPEGYVGGRKFFNREQKLRLKDDAGELIYYNEWDVNPKTQGQNRGTERLITGSDLTAYYTNDHYKTFIKIK